MRPDNRPERPAGLACALCGMPVSRPEGTAPETPVFCCRGCRTVYQLTQEALTTADMSRVEGEGA